MIIFEYIILNFYLHFFAFCIKVTNSFYGIKAASIFKGITSFTGVAFHSYDELHGFSNIAKFIIEMISPRYNTPYKYIGREDLYPFELTNPALDQMRDSVNKSRAFIPNAFASSFIGYDFRNSKSIYRSSDYIDFLKYNLILFVPLFADIRVGKAVSCLVRAVCLSSKFSITDEDLQEIEL